VKPFVRSHIYDSPDGKDCLYKVVHTAKVGALFGGVVSMYDIVGLSFPKGFLMTAGRMMTFVGPAAGAGGAFAAVSCMSGDLRGKDDWINHSFGTLAAGAIISTRLKSPGRGMAVTVLASIVMGIFKTVKNDGYQLIPTDRHPSERFLNGPFGPRNRQGYKEPVEY